MLGYTALKNLTMPDPTTQSCSATPLGHARFKNSVMPGHDRVPIVGEQANAL
jgi:hypothetical protein